MAGEVLKSAREGQGRAEPVAIYDQIMVEHLVRAAWPISQSHVAVPAPGTGKVVKIWQEQSHKEENMKMQHAFGSPAADEYYKTVQCSNVALRS